MIRDHGYTGTKIFQTWNSIKRTKDFPSEWKSSFSQFISDIGDPPSEDHILRKHDRSQPHSKENTCWINPKEDSSFPKADADPDEEYTYSVKLPRHLWAGIEELACKHNCLATRGKRTGEPSIARLFREIGEGKLTIVKAETSTLEETEEEIREIQDKLKQMDFPI